MVDQQTLNTTLQRAVLAVLCFDKEYSAAVAAQITPQHFDAVFRDFAAKVLKYRAQYNAPPGEHLDDLVAQTTVRDNKLIKRLAQELRAAIDGLNGEYVVTRVQDFVRRQVLKGALIEASDRYDRPDDNMVPDVERILHEALRYRSQTLDAGTFLDDPKALEFTTQEYEFYPLGIPVLDNLRIGMVPKELLLYIGHKGSGKTWFCVYCGKMAMLQQLSVLHVTLEFSERKITKRYFQSLFSIAREPGNITRQLLQIDDLGRIKTFDAETIKPKLDLSDPQIRKKLAAKYEDWGTRLGKLVVKEFPTGTLTIDHLIGYLDFLADVHNFVPNVLIVDYPDLMKVDRRNIRTDLGRIFIELRGLGVARNMAVVAPTQSNRKSIGHGQVRSTMVAEDITKVNTADTVIVFSQTDPERAKGTGRLLVEHVRDAGGVGSHVLLSQCYALGQYCLQSAQMQPSYWDKFKKKDGSIGLEDDDTAGGD